MKIRIRRKDNKILITSSICIVLGVGVIYKLMRKKTTEVMEEIAKQMFMLHLDEQISQMSKDEVKCEFEITHLQIISGNLQKFVVKINYDFNLIDEVEREYCTEQWMMKIIQLSNGDYEVTEEGEEIPS